MRKASLNRDLLADGHSHKQQPNMIMSSEQEGTKVSTKALQDDETSLTIDEDEMLPIDEVEDAEEIDDDDEEDTREPPLVGAVASHPPGEEAKSASRIPAPLMATYSKRQAHIVSEQKRRQNINEGFEELRRIIPSCQSSPDSKAVILRKAANYINQLVGEVARLKYLIANNAGTNGGHHGHHANVLQQNHPHPHTHPQLHQPPRQQPPHHPMRYAQYVAVPVNSNNTTNGNMMHHYQQQPPPPYNQYQQQQTTRLVPPHLMVTDSMRYPPMHYNNQYHQPEIIQMTPNHQQQQQQFVQQQLLQMHQQQRQAMHYPQEPDVRNASKFVLPSISNLTSAAPRPPLPSLMRGATFVDTSNEDYISSAASLSMLRGPSPRPSCAELSSPEMEEGQDEGGSGGGSKRRAMHQQ